MLVLTIENIEHDGQMVTAHNGIRSLVGVKYCSVCLPIIRAPKQALNKPWRD